MPKSFISSSEPAHSLLLGLSRAGSGIAKPTDQRNRHATLRYSATQPVSRLPPLEPHHFGARALDVLPRLRHMPEVVHGKQSSARILPIVKACISLHAKHHIQESWKSVEVLRPCGVNARPRDWATIDPRFYRGAASGDGTWRGGGGLPAARSHTDPMSTVQDLGAADGARDHCEHPWTTGTLERARGLCAGACTC